MKFKDRLDLRIYGSAIFEAMTLDMILSSCEDGFPRPQSILYEPREGISAFEAGRKADKLFEDGFLKPLGNNFLITSKGKLHLAKGGYTADFKQSKRVIISFWISIIACLLSLISFTLSIFKR